MGGAFLIAFVIQQHYVKQPILPVRLLRDRSRIACFIVTATHGFVYIGVFFYLPIYFILILGASQVEAGLWLLITAIPCVFTTAASGLLVKKTGHYRMIIIFATASLTLAVGLFIYFNEHKSWARIIGFQLVLSIGVGALLQVPVLAMQANIRVEEVSSANVALVFVRTLSSAVSIVVGQVLLQNQLKQREGELVASGIPQALVEAGLRQFESFRAATALTVEQQLLIRSVMAESLSRTWILYAAVAGVGFVASLFIQHRELSIHRQ